MCHAKRNIGRQRSAAAGIARQLELIYATAIETDSCAFKKET